MIDKSIIRTMPAAVFQAFDAMTHKTPQDLAFLAQHQIDLHEEGDCPLAPREVRSVKKFMERMRQMGGVK